METEFVEFEEARRCPKCKNPGEVDETARPGPDRSSIHVVWCRNAVCMWYNTNWIIQRLPDGTVPTRTSQPRREKQFPKLPGRKEQYVSEEATDEHLPPDPTSSSS